MITNIFPSDDSPFDNVVRPEHYTRDRTYEPKDVIRDWGLNFNLGNVVKYISRYGRKGIYATYLEDLKKAREYLNFEISALEREGYDKV